jgi:hypothetical protein
MISVQMKKMGCISNLGEELFNRNYQMYYYKIQAV